MQSELNNTEQTVQDEQQEQVVLFKFKRAYHEESYDQIKIQSKKIKANSQAVEKAEQNYRKQHFLDRETMLTNLFQKLELNQKQSQQQIKNEQPTKDKEKSTTKQQQSNKKEYFLKKVQVSELTNGHQQSPQIKQTDNNEIFTQMKNIRTHARKTDLQQKLNKFRKIGEKLQVKKRIKYKIIDIKQQNIVDFGGQKFEYQDLSKEYTANQMPANIKYDYYVLRKGQMMRTSNLPQIILPQQAQYLLQQEQNTKIQAQTPQNSQQDSNRQDRSDYDYPQQDYHQGDEDDQSQGIISGGNGSEQQYGSDDEKLNNSYRQEDEEQYYRQYLKRCKKQNQGDDELTYLYNLKSDKYDEDSDD